MPKVMAAHGTEIQSTLGNMLRISGPGQGALMMALGQVTQMRATLVVDHTQASMEFDLPQRSPLIVEAMNVSKGLMDTYGGLVADPSFLAMSNTSAVPVSGQ